MHQTIEHAPDLRVDLDKGLVVNGLSAGGKFACIITQRARKDPIIKDKITGQLLQIPSTCSPGPNGFPERSVLNLSRCMHLFYKLLRVRTVCRFRGKLLSLEQNANAPILNKENMEMFLGLTSSILVLNLNLFITRKYHRGIQRGSRNSLGSLSSPRRILRWTPCSLYTGCGRRSAARRRPLLRRALRGGWCTRQARHVSILSSFAFDCCLYC